MSNTNTNRSWHLEYKDKKLECPFEWENMEGEQGAVLDLLIHSDGKLVFGFEKYWIRAEELNSPDNDEDQNPPIIVFDDVLCEKCEHQKLKHQKFLNEQYAHQKEEGVDRE